MSSWTYVHGMVELDVMASTSAEAIFKAQTIVDHLPRITGSEGPAKWAVVPVTSWANVHSGIDELRHRSNLGKRSSWSDYEFERQTRVMLVLQGDLRDRYFEETLYETTKCLSRLAARVRVNHCLVRVSHWGRTYVFSDPSWVVDQYDSDWTANLVNWQTIPGYGYPDDYEEERV